MDIGAFLYNNLEWIIAITSGVGYGSYMLSRRKHIRKRPSNKLTRYVVKYKKYQDSINKQVKPSLR
jgi:hypothetical protein